MIIKNLSKAFFALICLAIPLAAANKRTLVTLQGETVADVLYAEQNERTGFCIPLLPQFVWESIMEYPALYKTRTGTLTAASLLRFMQQSHSLFELKDQAAYKNNLNEAIKTHRKWHSNKTNVNLRELQKAESIVFRQLQQLNLHQKEIKEKLEQILSTPEQLSITQKYHGFILPNRATITYDFSKGIYIKRTNKKSLGAHHLLKILELVPHAAVAWLASEILEFDYFRIVPTFEYTLTGLCISFVGFRILTALHSLLASFTNFKLIPEPGNGIKVTIELSHQKLV